MTGKAELATVGGTFPSPPGARSPAGPVSALASDRTLQDLSELLSTLGTVGPYLKNGHRTLEGEYVKAHANH